MVLSRNLAFQRASCNCYKVNSSFLIIFKDRCFQKTKMLLLLFSRGPFILTTIHFCKVCTMTSLAINLIPEPGGGEELGVRSRRSSKSEEQQTPPRRINIFKKQLSQMKAGSMKMVYVNCQVSTHVRDFTVAILFFYDFQ